MSPFDPFLERQGFVVLDGGLASALEAAGHVLDTELWSAEVLLDDPDAVRAVHAAYLDAGADCVTTGSYQASLPGFARLGIGADRAADALRRSVELAREARAAYRAEGGNRTRPIEPLVAASVGPYGAFLADGSEYDGRYGVGRDVLERFHRPRLEILSRAGADVLALETIPSLVEAELLGHLISELTHPGAWMSFSCRDGEHLRDGSPIEDAVGACADAEGLVAVGVNCTAPVFVESLVRRMRAVTELPIVAYPNSGETFDAASRGWSGSPAGPEWVELVPAWLDAGARIVGGCCRVGPDVIREVRRKLEAVVRGSGGAAKGPP
ncbi:MAG TPA: homocysteine S-methyltransferase [Longimicrobiales bacterium]|nr:homocysteine S-methyltransferase [Longimicrobiales bacterium]